MARVHSSAARMSVAALIAVGAVLTMPTPAPALLRAEAGVVRCTEKPCSAIQDRISTAPPPPSPRRRGPSPWLTLATDRFAAGIAEGPVPDTVPAARDTVAHDTIAGPIPPRPAIPLASEADLLVRASLHALAAPLRWSGREWATVGASVGGVALLSTADEAGRDLMDRVRSDRNSRIELLVEPFGAERSLQLMGGMLFTGLVIDNEKLRSTAVEGLAAGLVAAGIVTPALQKVIGRAKPRAGLPAHSYEPFGGDRSLPSGHTTQAFAVASVIATEYGHPAVQLAAYGMATAVGVSRMYRRSHFLSDVVGAAIIGSATGRCVARFGIRARKAREGPEDGGAQEARESLSVMPIVSPSALGLIVDLRF